MAITLSGSLSADAKTMNVSGTVPASIVPPYRFRLDDEFLVLLAFAKPWAGGTHTWRVRRGVEGSTKATHSNGATVKGVVDAWVSSTTETPPDPFASSGAGGSITVTGSQGGSVAGATEIRVAGLVVPLDGTVAGQGLAFYSLTADLAFDTPNLVDQLPINSPILFTIPAGSVFQCSLLIGTFWNDTGGFLLLAGATDEANPTVLAQYNATSDSNYEATASVAVESAARHTSLGVYAGSVSRWAYALSDLVVRASFSSDNAPPTAGTATVIAIVAAPAV